MPESDDSFAQLSFCACLDEMMKKISLAVLAVLLCQTGSAEQGLVIQFSIEERQLGSDSSEQYTDAILMKFSEEVVVNLHDLYTVKVNASELHSDATDLIITLKDLVDGKPYYVGAKSLKLTVGSRAEFSLQREDRLYRVELDTSFGTIPNLP